MDNSLDKFKEIRPYLDEEIRPVLDSLLSDEEFLDSIARFYYPRLTLLFPSLVMKMAKIRWWAVI